MLYIALMPVIKIIVPHQLGMDEARQRILRLMAETKAKFDAKISEVEETWNGNRGLFRFKAMGFSVSGNLNVEPNLANVEINLPFAALPFKSRIESDLTTRARELLA